ncbi:acylneuraminate cytidylyltransferase family protein [Oceanimonas marisflavi]|uniref:acylneuraminate cytidylyltransferase family protein n=1 Tax=Oceanimonas marisflavi TaxID=2059724 RepID=UPI000D30A290|nr:acylneuraminate cytidylyltransferase family protein [Oceanimonas marisflavi]
MRNFCFIFARGGSKGLPRKNIKLLNGKPLLQYSIDTALACSSIEQVFVSTDDPDIARVAKNSGACVIKRPSELATDSSPEWLSWRHGIEWAREHFGNFDHFVSLPATSPLRSVEDVESAIKQRLQQQADICISVTPSNRSPFFNMVKKDAQGYLSLVNPPEGEVSRRQDAPDVFDITTVVYVAKPDFVISNYGIFSGKVTSIEVPKVRAIDIDDIYDFKLAEAILSEC